MTFIGITNPAYHPLFLTMCPTYTFIDRADGYINRSMDFKKDYAALIAAAWDIDTRYDEYLTHADMDTYEAMKALHLDEATSEESKEIRDKLIRNILDGKIKGSFAKRYGGEE